MLSSTDMDPQTHEQLKVINTRLEKLIDKMKKDYETFSCNAKNQLLCIQELENIKLILKGK